MKTSEKQNKVFEQFRNTTAVIQVKRALDFTPREVDNIINILYMKGILKRIKKGHYIISDGETKNIKIDLKPLEIKELGKLDQIPQKLWEYVWQNRKVRCSQLKQITGIPRFYIRQYIHLRKLQEFPRLREY
jgi:hypothetical protein